MELRPPTLEELRGPETVIAEADLTDPLRFCNQRVPAPVLVERDPIEAGPEDTVVLFRDS